MNQPLNELVHQGFASLSARTFGARLLVFMLGLASSVILARTLGPEGRGAFALLIAFATMLTILVNLGLHSANIYYGAGYRHNLADIIGNSLTVAFLVGVVLIISGIGLSYVPQINHFLETNLVKPHMLWLILSSIPFSLLSTYLSSILLSHGHVSRFNLSNICQSALQLAFFILLLLLFQQGLEGSVIAYVSSVLATTLIVVAWTRSLAPLKFRWNCELLRDFIRYGLKANIGHIAQILNYRLDMFLVAYFLNPAEVGFYAIAVGMAERIWMIPDSINTVLFPKISAARECEANALTPMVSRHTSFLVTMIAVGAALIAKPFVITVYGPEFAPSVLPFLLLLPGVMILSLGKILANDLAGRGKPEYWTIGAWVSLGLTLVLDLLLIPHWGIAGAAVASSLSYTLGAAIVVGAFRKIAKIGFKEITVLERADTQVYKSFILVTIAKLWRRSSSK
jgi:O-antigen/teichoic acid export membrane protein